MLVLGIDTSGKTGSVAIYDKEIGLISEINLQVKLNHSDTLMTAIDDVMNFSNLKIDDIDLIAVSIGPGSFTGIRIGVATAKGLALSKQKNIVGVNTLDILAAGTSETSIKVIPLIDARKGRVYYSVYMYQNGVLEAVENYHVGELVDVLEKYKDEKVLFTGNGSINYQELIIEKLNKNALFNGKANSYPRACVLAYLGLSRETSNVHLLEPFYLSKSQAERMKNKK